ncbi:hypothetical protein Kpol_1020p36 [Vanderwaltozyma polyspora DSM 70294]|uniref:HORMA domain-containing protein n=1 Tax=Vanderwaltozyma polyspora (strain ATCC 22028 / DSM 70294 / BCRC 21397 / CBS 2163 / NBRC 10782 / NRRL Y-8283 / UCD 57-17) TaxID=436907 RepID=A7TLE6_VANPO|nr:uncharacterized protein Kpol_1020p36 [Vanderwaltozyma polyspora DSM 70294]EDO16927.1 hypothetical protein Kpol_1020p36 [Vanderwaltozyma polyspora DSM 70294]
MNKWVNKWIRVYLKCYINLILYHRNVYPEVSFDITTYQGFNLPQSIPINRHVGLQNYIEELIEDLLSKILKIYRFSICITSFEDNICVEKYVLDFGEFKHIENIGTLQESEVFDEFRSSLNSLISILEKMPPISDDTVTFEATINVIDMQLGENSQDISTITNEEQKLEYERDTNWTKSEEDDNNGIHLSKSDSLYLPKTKMTSIVGCDVGPLIIYAYCEQLLTADERVNKIYPTSDTPELISSI